MAKSSMLTLEPKHLAMWARASQLTQSAIDPADGKFQPRAYHRRPRARVEASLEVEPDAPSMTVAEGK